MRGPCRCAEHDRASQVEADKLTLKFKGRFAIRQFRRTVQYHLWLRGAVIVADALYKKHRQTQFMKVPSGVALTDARRF
jgi:hypothetical protein